MSYCRWSCDDYQCDLYIYEDCYGGWTTHVAGRRHVFKEPLPAPLPGFANPGDAAAIDAWVKRHQTIMRMTEAADLVPIGLPHDGERFNSDTPGECADLVDHLRSLGYRCPEYVAAALREEQAEMDVPAPLPPKEG